MVDGDLIPGFPCLARVDLLTGIDLPPVVGLPCLVGVAPYSVGCSVDGCSCYVDCAAVG